MVVRISSVRFQNVSRALPAMFGVGGEVAEAFVAHPTVVGPFARVNALVGAQRGTLHKALETFVALVALRLLGIVPTTVSPETGSGTIMLATGWAHQLGRGIRLEDGRGRQRSRRHRWKGCVCVYLVGKVTSLEVNVNVLGSGNKKEITKQEILTSLDASTMFLLLFVLWLFHQQPCWLHGETITLMLVLVLVDIEKGRRSWQWCGRATER